MKLHFSPQRYCDFHLVDILKVLVYILLFFSFRFIKMNKGNYKASFQDKWLCNNNYRDWIKKTEKS